MLIEQVQRQEVGSEADDHRGRGAPVLRRPPEEFTEPIDDHAARDPDRDPAGRRAARRSTSQADDEAQKKIADDPRARAERGGLRQARPGSLASTSKANGGLIGPFSREDMSPNLQAMIDKMKPGEITQPIKTPRGYQIFKLESMKPRRCSRSTACAI
jgi:hypothetical protein